MAVLYAGKGMWVWSNTKDTKAITCNIDWLFFRLPKISNYPKTRNQKEYDLIYLL